MDLGSLVPSVITLVEKLGIVGILLIAMYFLVRELMRMRAELSKVYRQRDGARLAFVKLRTVLEQNVPPIRIEMGDLDALLKDEA